MAFLWSEEVGKSGAGPCVRLCCCKFGVVLVFGSVLFLVVDSILGCVAGLAG